MTKGVLFDMDGVIVDSEPFHHNRMVEFFRRENIPVPEERLYLLIGSNAKLNHWPKILKNIPLPCTEKDLLQKMRAYMETLAPLDYASVLDKDAKPLLDRLIGEGYKTALASSSKMAYIQRMLAQCGLEGKFHCVVSGEMFTQSKPDPEIYRHTANLLNLPPEECIAVEDSYYGILAAKRAGMTVAAKRDINFKLDQSMADYMIDRLSDITELLTK